MTVLQLPPALRDLLALAARLLLGVVLLAAAGPGRFSLDHVLAQRRERATVGV
jgi:uncharacterized membrane protein YphA (DoxX/SURF4 family)